MILNEILHNLKEEMFAKGSKIFSQNESCEKIYFVKKGHIELIVESEEIKPFIL